MMAIKAKTFLGLFAALLLFAGNAQAILTIEVIKGDSEAAPIAIVPFGWEGPDAPPLDIAQIIKNDLYYSGQFAPIPEQDMLAKPTDGAKINFRNWRMLDVPYLVIGKLKATGIKAYELRFQLYDVFRGQQLKGLVYPVTVPTMYSDQEILRRQAHRISDVIYEELTGVKGAFDTKVAYVTRDRKREFPYWLVVADADGANPKRILRSPREILSPAWSPDGKRIAYVSFEKNRPQVIVQNKDTGKRQVVAGFDGSLNGSPEWSPDGKQLALQLSKDGNAEIYVYHLDTRRLKRITRHWAIDVEPTWAPDGKSLVFVSERGGGAQLYRYWFSSKRVERVTFEGKQNLNPSFSPDGRLLTFIHNDGTGQHVAVMELDTGILRVLTDTMLDESPSFAPNGSMIIYATIVKNRKVLAAVSTDGRRQLTLPLKNEEGDVLDPSWSPFLE